MTTNQILVNNFLIIYFSFLYDFRAFLFLICTSILNFTYERQNLYLVWKSILERKNWKAEILAFILNIIKAIQPHLRDFEYLELYLTTEPETPAERKKNKENLELAEQILTIRKAEVYQGSKSYDIFWQDHDPLFGFT